MNVNDSDEQDIPLAAQGETAPLRRQGFCFFAAVFAFLMVFAASSVPIPLYAEYKVSFGLSDDVIAATMFTYLFGVLAVLFFAGRLSDALGRRPLTLAALVFAVAGCVMFWFVASAPMLLAARFVQGISCGLTMSAVAALVIDAAAGKRAALGTTVVGCGSLIGIMMGSLFVAAWCALPVDYAFAYLIMIACLVLAALFVVLSPETVQQRISLGSAVKPALFLNPAARAYFLYAACAYIATWGVGTFFQSFSAAVALDCFGMRDIGMASLILALAMAPSGLGGPLEARLPAGVSLRIGMVSHVVVSAGMCVCMAAGNVALFLACNALASVAMGVCLSGSLRLLLAHCDASETARVVSVINITGYAGAAALSMLMGATVPVFGLAGTLGLLVAFCVACCAAVFAKSRSQARKRACEGTSR